MSKKYLVSYGNTEYYNSLERLRLMALETGRFDDVFIYTDRDLPEKISSHELMKYKRGGGYWLWKPWVIYDALSRIEDEDMLVYCDSGNEVFDHPEWDVLFDELTKCDMILFKYGAIMEQWSKNELIRYFENDYIKRRPHIGKYYQLQGGLQLASKKAMSFYALWLDFMVSHPEYVIDVSESEKKNQKKGFVEHRHDQCVLTCLAYSHKEDYKIKIKWQHGEFLDRKGQAVYFARISDSGRRSRPGVYEPRWRYWAKKLIITPYRNCRESFFKLMG